MDADEAWETIDRRRARLADVLTELSPEEWARPSLCEGWTVRDVAGHLTMAALRPAQMLGLLLRHPGGTNRLIRDGSIDLARRNPPQRLVEQIRGLIGNHRPIPGLSVRESLIDIVGHTLDIVIPLDREHAIAPVEAAEAADGVVGYGGRGKAKVFRQLPMDGLRLVATDHDWSNGTGHDVNAAMTDLFLLLTGRTARVAALEGPGASILRDRLGDRIRR